MADNTPLIDRAALENSIEYPTLPTQVDLPNLPFTGFNTPLPQVDGQPTPSAVSAIENNLLSIKPQNGPLMGGSIPRTLAEVTSERYNTFVPGDYDNEDAYAQGQGLGSKMVSGVGKGLALTATTFLQSTAGLVNGVGRMIGDGRAASFYDNEFNRALDELNKKLENALPNYYTNVEKNAKWYSPDKLVTANFFWDGIVKNLGFAAGAALAGGTYAYGLRALPLTSRLFSVGKAAETLAATEESLMAANKVAEGYGKIRALSDKFLNSYNVLNAGGRAVVAGLATTGEAGFEAYHNLNEFRNQKIEEYKATHGGVEPVGGDLDRINAEADNVGNSSFLLNTALLSATNYIQFPKIIGSSYAAEKGILNNEISNITQDATGAFVKQEAKTRTGRILSTLNKIRPYTFSSSEAFEEGAQYAISVGTKDYYDKKYDGDTASFIDSLFAGISGTLGTDEGMQNVLIGGLSGALMQGVGRFKESAQTSRNTADAIQRFNNWRLSDFTRATVDSVNRGTILQEERETALRQGDILTSKDKEADYLINYLTPRIKYGRFDLVQADIDDYKKLASTEEGFSQLQAEGKALATDTRTQYLQRLGNLETSANSMKSLYQSLQLRYGGLRTADNQPLYSPEVMDKMIYAASKVADYDTRLPQLSLSLVERGILVGDLATDIVSNKEDKYKEALQQIQELDVNSDVKDDLLQNLEDYSEILLRRKKFLDEYDEIKRNPQDHKEDRSITAPKKETLTIKTKVGDKDVETGTEYFVGRVVEYDKSGKEVYRSPRITILAENEDGTIQIKDSQGNIKNISKSVLEDYKLAKVSDTLSNKKAKFFMDHWNTIYEFNFGKGKKQRGRLEYSGEEGVLNFVYKDKSGKTRRIEVTGDQFVPKKGFVNPQISAVGELTVAQKQSLENFAKETDTRTADKRSARLSILNDLFNEVTDKHNKTVKLIAQKQSEITNIQEELSDLEESIKSAESDKRSKSAFRFRSNAKKALDSSIRLSRTKDQLEQEVQALETEREELEFNADYISDLSQNIDELPTDSKEFLEELKDQQSILEDLVIENGKQINNISKLIDSVQGALDSAINFLRDLLDKFEKKYPNTPLAIGEDLVEFLKENPRFLKYKPDYLTDLRNLEDLVAQVEDLDITPSERHINELQAELSTLQSTLKEVEKEIKAKDAILSRFEDVAKKYTTQKEQEKKIADNQNLKQQFLGTADTGPEIVSTGKDYEPDAKKTDIGIVTSTKAVSFSDLPHHIRANQFGANLDKFPNRTNIKGVIVTSKNEAKYGLTGLMNSLKGDSDVDATKIVSLVMVNEKGIPVGVDGKELESPSFDNIIVQVFPDPKLEWSKEFGGKTMFRKETSPEQIEFYKKQYGEWVNEQLNSPSSTLFNIDASFGIPQYVTNLDQKGNSVPNYDAVVSVEEAQLIKKSDLKEKQDLIKVATTEEVIDKGTVKFTIAPGRPYLNLPNGILKLNNRKLTSNEASTIYEAIHQLAIEGDPKSEKSQRLIKWLKSIIYWGTPKNAAGYNSVFFKKVGNDFQLFISGQGKSYPFTPLGISNNKIEIVALLEQMYNNIQSGLLNKDELWNEPYEEITNISEKGDIQTKEWDNYRTFLLSRDGRKDSELPLSANLKPIEKEGDVNRVGIYFTIKDDVDRYLNVPTKKVETPVVKTEPAKQDKFILDGKKVNTFTSPSGRKMRFAASSEDNITILTGLDGDAILKELTEKFGKDRAVAIMKNEVKKAILPQLEEEEEFTIGEDEPAPKVQPKKDISPQVKAAKIEVSMEDEEQMSKQIEDIDDEDTFTYRVKLEKEINSFEKENWPKAEKWLKDNFPTLPVYRVKNIIKATNGLQAWGMLKDGALYVTENAEVGTIYHEVFEGIWNIFTTPEERSKVQSEFKARKGSFVDRPTGKTIQYSQATAQEIKEQLAEEFRDYILNPPKKKSFLSQIFSDLVQFIKGFFTGNKAVSNTDELFKKIGTGYYKQYTPTSQFSFAKKGLIDIEEAYGNNSSEFRIKDIQHDVVNDIMQHMTYLTLKDLIYGESRTGVELYEYLKYEVTKAVMVTRKAAQDSLKEGNITIEQAQDKVNEAVSLWKRINNEWSDIEEKHREYLRAYQVEFDENDEVILKDEDKSNKSFEQDATKIDVFKKADKKLRLLLATVPIVNSDGKMETSSINGAKLLPASQVFMTVMNRTHTSRNLPEMINRIKELSEENVNYKTLYNRLTKNTSDLSQVNNTQDVQLLSSLWRTFKKQSPEVKNVYIFENGDVEVGDSNLSTAARQIASEYANSLIKTIKGKNPYFEYSTTEKAYIGKPISVKSVKLTSIHERVNFLKSLGIEFKVNEVNKLSSDKKDTFNEAVAGIKKSIQDAGKIATVNRKILDIKGRMHQLSLIQASIENPEFDSTFFNGQGERTQTFIGTNPVSDLHDYLSQVKNIKDLVNTPFEYLLSDTFSKGSVILSKIFNLETGNRISGGELLMKPGWADSLINQQNNKKKSSGKQTYKERIVQETNLNLSGYYYNLVPGDSSLEWMVYMGNHVTPDALLSGWKRVNDIFKGYFISELNLSREERPINEKKDRKITDLRFFKPILGAELHNPIIKEKGTPEEVYSKYESKINKAVQSFIEQESKKTRELFERYEILKRNPEGEFIAENVAFKSKDSLKEESLTRELNALSANFAINNIELHKLIYSDPYQYSDELKRIKNANSPRQSIIHNSPEFNMALNDVWNKGYDQEDIGYTDFTRDYFKTVTAADITGTSDLKDYGTFDETDGGGIITLKAHRWLRIKAGEWSTDEEKQYKYDVAYEKRDKNIELSKEEKRILDQPNPSVKSTYTPLKPIVFGNKANGKSYNDVDLDKFALYPLSYRIMKEINPSSNAIKLYNKMQREDMDYLVFASGRKVGSEGTNKLYNEDGSFNQLPFNYTINIPHSIIAIQSEVPSKDEPLVTRGSQITKLATLDFMDAGVPIDYKKDGKFADRYKAWYGLTEDQRKKESPLYKEIKHNQEVLEQLIEQGYLLLLNKLGIEQTADGAFQITDFTKAGETLREEILKREVNDNVIDSLTAFLNGSTLLEATPAYQQVRNILYSIADKNVISAKISGGQKVQIPSSLLESVRPAGKNGVFQSDVLDFYKDEDGKRICEIMVGRWFDSDLSDDKLLTYLNNTKEGQKILSGVAYRIPTQKQNSIDAFRIKQFLPREFGDSVVIPSALVKKVGSDFDIDKLYVYFKNVFTNLKGEPKLVPFVGYGEEAKSKLSKMYEEGAFLNEEQRKIVNNWASARKEEDRNDATNRLAVAIFGEGSYEQEVIDDFLDARNSKDLQAKIIDRVYKQSLENEYIQSLENLISSPENFENLIKPNSADQLKQLAKDITKAIGNKEFDYSSTENMLSKTFMSSLRQAFVSGKYAIGIAAVNQTNHSLNQRQPIYIDPERWTKSTPEDLYWLTGGTMKKEDIAIKFKGFNKIEIDGKMVATLSMVKNAAGENISDIIGQFIDGYVDISKGPWIMELGATPNVAGVWLFLTKVGVPIDTVAYFMNQPIIRDYLTKIENSGYSWLFIDNFVKEMAELYPARPDDVASIKEIPSNLKATVQKRTGFSKDNAGQQFILKEFLKYAKMANHMFLVTQGSNWDTATFNDPFLVFKKLKQLEKAQSTIISSVNDLMNNSFIKKLTEKIYDTRDALSTILISDLPNTREVLEKVLTPYVDLTDREFVKVARKAVSDLFDWAVQNDRKLNTQVTNILLSDSNAASEINDFVVSVRRDPSHPLYNNQVVKLITPHFSEKREGGVNNIKIKNKDNKVYDQNQMIYAFNELREYLKGQDNTLYGSLVRLAVLQSGLSNSPISFTSLLPYEDFKEIYNKTLLELENSANLEDFYNLNVFERNNWNDDDLVPTVKAKKSRGGEGKYNTNMKFYGNNKVANAIDKGTIPPLVKINTKSGASDADVIVYSWVTAFGDKAKKMKEMGDFSYIKKGLFKKIYRGSEPFTSSYLIKDKLTGENTVITDYVYKAINAWGDSHVSDGIYYSANEFYSTPRQSVIDNGFIKVENELSDETILTFFDKPVKQTVSNTKIDDSQTKIPNCK